MLTVLLGGAALLAIIAVINPLTGKAILAAISGSTGAFGRWLRSKFPVWIMQYELDKASREINYYWGAIEENKAHSNGLERRAVDKRREVTRLDKLSRQAASQQTPEGDTDARAFLKDKKRVQEELNSIETTLMEKGEELETALANIASYEEFVQETKQEAEAKAVRLQTKKIDAALSRKLSGLHDLKTGGLAMAKESLDQAMDAAEAATEINKVRNKKQVNERKYTQTTINEEVEKDLAALKAEIADKKNNPTHS